MIFKYLSSRKDTGLLDPCFGEKPRGAGQR